MSAYVVMGYDYEDAWPESVYLDEVMAQAEAKRLEDEDKARSSAAYHPFRVVEVPFVQIV